jgi:hypothetical protein
VAGRVPRKRRVGVIGVVFAAVLLMLTSCSGSFDAGERAADADAETAASTSTTDDPRVPAVLKAYEAYWAAVLASADPPDPESGQLKEHAVDEELKRVRSVLSELQRAGDVMRGSYGHEAFVRSIDDTEAVVADCLAPRTTIHDGSTGEVTVGETGGTGLVTAQMVLEGDAWKVALIEAGQGACPTGSETPPPEAVEGG